MEKQIRGIEVLREQMKRSKSEGWAAASRVWDQVFENDPHEITDARRRIKKANELADKGLKFRWDWILEYVKLNNLIHDYENKK